jgi:hypothetical protein
MSDSGDEDAQGKGEKKNMFYKIKALKRRTVHAVAKNLGKAEQTKDPEFDVLYERFEEVDANMAKLQKSMQKYAAAQKALADAGSELAHDFLALYDKDPFLKKLAVEMEAINEYMVSEVSPQLGERWEQQVCACGHDHACVGVEVLVCPSWVIAPGWMWAAGRVQVVVRL